MLLLLKGMKAIEFIKEFFHVNKVRLGISFLIVVIGSFFIYARQYSGNFPFEDFLLWLPFGFILLCLLALSVGIFLYTRD